MHGIPNFTEGNNCIYSLFNEDIINLYLSKAKILTQLYVSELGAVIILRIQGNDTWKWMPVF